MSSLHSEHSTENKITEFAPDFPHAWTFSSQRYVPRPRPVARIVLPSHHRASNATRFEFAPLSAAVSPTDSLRPLVRLVREGDSVTRFCQVTWIQKLYSLYEHLAKTINVVVKKARDSFVVARRPIPRGSQVL